MKLALRIGFCCLVAGSMMAQMRGGGGRAPIGGGRGPAGGASTIRGGFNSGFNGGFSGGIGAGMRGGFGTGNAGYGNLYRGFGGLANRFTPAGYGAYLPGRWGTFGLGYGNYGFAGSLFWPSLYALPPYSYWGSDVPNYAAPTYEYNPSPNVTVIYPAPQEQPARTEPVEPVIRTYDRNGQEIQPGAATADAPNASPIYLIAAKDQIIRAAESYRVEGNTLHYVTMQHEARQMPLDSVDRPLTERLNRERHVAVRLPQ